MNSQRVAQSDSVLKPVKGSKGEIRLYLSQDIVFLYISYFYSDEKLVLDNEGRVRTRFFRLTVIITQSANSRRTEIIYEEHNFVGVLKTSFVICFYG